MKTQHKSRISSNQKAINLILIFAFAILFMHTSGSLYAQNTNKLRRLEIKYEQFRTKYKPQQILLYVSGDTYKNLDTILFQATVLNHKQEVDFRETTLFAELIAPNNKSLRRIMLRVEYGMAMGHIPIPENLAHGEYQIQVYTNQMKNFGSRVFAVQKIKVGNTSENIENKQAHSKRKIKVEIIPEGGNMFFGSENSIFIGVKSDSANLEFSGRIVSEKGDVLQEFSSNQATYVVSKFTPEPGVGYYVEILSPITKREKLELTDKTAAIRLNEISKESCAVSILNSPENKQKYILAGVQNQALVFEKEIGAFNTIIKLNFDSLGLKPGVLQLYLVDNNYESVSSRLIFIPWDEDKTNDMSNILDSAIIIGISDNVDPKSSHQFKLNYLNTFTRQKLGDVISQSEFAEKYNHWLIGQQPSWFNMQNIDKALEIDTVFQVVKGIEVNGLVSKLFQNRVAGSKVALSNLEDYYQSSIKLTNEEGKFFFRNLNIKDSALLYVEAYETEGRTNLVITLDEEPIYRHEYFKELGVYEHSDTSIAQDNSNLAFVIKNSQIEKLGNVQEKHAKEQTIYGEADYVIKIADRKANYTSVLQVLSGVPGLRVEGPFVYIRGTSSMLGNNLPLILLDGVSTDYSILQQINPNDLDRIEILKSPNKLAMFGLRGGNGVIALYSKQGHFNDAFAIDVRLLGYQSKLDVSAKSQLKKFEARFTGADNNNNSSTNTYKPIIRISNKGVISILP